MHVNYVKIITAVTDQLQNKFSATSPLRFRRVRKIVKAAISFVMSVRPSAGNNPPPTRRI